MHLHIYYLLYSSVTKKTKTQMQETSLSQLDEWKGKTRKERRKSGKVEKHALVSEKPT